MPNKNKALNLSLPSIQLHKIFRIEHFTKLQDPSNTSLPDVIPSVKSRGYQINPKAYEIFPCLDAQGKLYFTDDSLKQKPIHGKYKFVALQENNGTIKFFADLEVTSNDTRTHINNRSPLKPYVLNHSDFVAGKDVVMAGFITFTDQGHILKINNESGHYKPNVENLKGFGHYLLDKYELSSLYLEDHSQAPSQAVFDIYLVNDKEKYKKPQRSQSMPMMTSNHNIDAYPVSTLTRTQSFSNLQDSDNKMNVYQNADAYCDSTIYNTSFTGDDTQSKIQENLPRFEGIRREINTSRFIGTALFNGVFHKEQPHKPQTLKKQSNVLGSIPRKRRPIFQ